MNLIFNIQTLFVNSADENNPYKDGGDFFHALVYSDFKGFFKPISFQDYPFWITISTLIFSFVFLLIIKTKSETFITMINQKYNFPKPNKGLQEKF